MAAAAYTRNDNGQLTYAVQLPTGGTARNDNETNKFDDVEYAGYWVVFIPDAHAGIGGALFLTSATNFASDFTAV